MAKKKNGRIAVPFLITIFIGLIIIGGAALFIYKYFNFGGDEELTEPIAREIATVSYEDSHTILLILDTPEEKCTSSFMLMRSIPKDKKLLFVGIPANSIALIDGKQASLTDSYATGGAPSAVSFTENTFGIDIDRYMVFDADALSTLCDIIGGVSYAVNVDIAGIKNTSEEQFLNGEQVLTLLTYPLYNDGENQRAYITSSIFSAMINQADGKRMADDLDRNFNTMINLVKSDISSVDFKNRKTAIKTMFERGTSIARFRIAEGTPATNDFIISQEFIDQLNKEYFADMSDEEEKK